MTRETDKYVVVELASLLESRVLADDEAVEDAEHDSQNTDNPVHQRHLLRIALAEDHGNVTIVKQEENKYKRVKMERPTYENMNPKYFRMKSSYFPRPTSK